jgi:hypothetical protein
MRDLVCQAPGDMEVEEVGERISELALPERHPSVEEYRNSLHSESVELLLISRFSFIVENWRNGGSKEVCKKITLCLRRRFRSIHLRCFGLWKGSVLR